MDKLELKHLAPYLPYGLTVEFVKHSHHNHCKNILIGLDIEKSGTDVFRWKGVSEYTAKIDVFESNEGDYNRIDVIHSNEIKPFLRPLSDLTKLIEINGKKCVPIHEAIGAGRMRCDSVVIKGKAIEFTDIPDPNDHILDENGQIHPSCSVYIYKQLIEWHFDVFGLIEKGLAITKTD